MRRVSIFSILKKVVPLSVICFLAACSLEKESGVNRALQNLTARYNIIFNAKEILRQKQEDYALGFVDAYDQLLSVYQDTAALNNKGDKDLEAIIAKANNVIAIKEQSNYLDDAYLLLGKANYLGGEYFNAVEYFNYVIRSFPQSSDLVQESRVWKARALLYLNQPEQAKLVLDTAFQNIDLKKGIAADIYATRLQHDIDVQDFTSAEEMAKKAVEFSNNKRQRLRWTFILAQIQELNRKPADAYSNYMKVVNSNASFELSFNANLNRIRIGNGEDNTLQNRIAGIRRLLRDDKNADFIDQIYYQIAELYLTNNDIDNAIKNYQLSLKNSSKNQTQKGLSYLRLADISFKNKADYVSAKKYYDSTLLNLPVNYPGYFSIQKKSNNLQLLADRLQTIAREDTLQMLAKLSDEKRNTVVNEMVNRRAIQNQSTVNSSNNNAQAALNPLDPKASTPTGSSFYFYNVNAISQGITDFKRKWGNRKLEDNWRRSNRSNPDLSNVTKNVNPDLQAESLQKKATDLAADNYRQEIMQAIPLTDQQLAESNLRVYNAYLDMANFYRDVLDDKKEAIEIYELLLTRFPDDINKVAVYYNLYRLYSDIDPKKSNNYKSLILANYPTSPFARVINDPDYNQRQNDVSAELNSFYNQLYDAYVQRRYTEVITQADQLLQQYPDNKLATQILYLRAIAMGHQQKLQPFRDELAMISSKYPTDQLITPLINQHLAFIDANQTQMAARRYALMDTDPNELPFIPPVVNRQPQMASIPPSVKNDPKVQNPAIRPAIKTQDVKPADNTVIPAKPPVINNAPQQAVVPLAPSIFSLRDSTNYYFVVNVATGTTNLASSRFGIGQFNRTNFQGNSIKHQLKNAGPDNQLIYVGRFYSIDAVKDYARAIIPLMRDIMKVPADKYSFFIITQENLDKLADKKLLDSYIDYYQKNY